MPTISCPIPIARFEDSVRDTAEAVTLPPECYTSPEFWEFEKEAIFYREWLCLGRADQIPSAGDYFTITIANEPLIVVRDELGGVNVMSAVCRHRGTVIADDAGNCRAFRCPYHWWTYDHAGQLVGAPGMTSNASFEPGSTRLPNLAVEIWNGFVFANFDPEASPLAPRLARVEPLLEDYHLGDLVTTEPDIHADLPFNWKIMMENGTEPYHAPYLHHKHVPKPPPGTRGNFLEFGENDGFLASIVDTVVPDIGINPTRTLFLPPISTLTESGRRRWVFGGVPPNLNIFWEPDSVSWFILVPNGPDTVTLMWGYCVEPGTLDDPSFADRIEHVRAGIDVFNRDDFLVNVLAQRGQSSRFAVRGPYADEEEILVQLNRWLVTRYRAQADRAGAEATA